MEGVAGGGLFRCNEGEIGCPITENRTVKYLVSPNKTVIIFNSMNAFSLGAYVSGKAGLVRSHKIAPNIDANKGHECQRLDSGWLSS